MIRMWRGPCEAIRATESDPLWAAIQRRNGRLGVFCNVDNDARVAEFYTIEERRGGLYQIDLGRVEGNHGDPYLLCLWGSHDFTDLDPELIQLHHQYLGRLAENIVLDGRMLVSKLEAAAMEFQA